MIVRNLMLLLSCALFFSSIANAQIKYQKPDKMISDLVASPGFSYPQFNRQYTQFIKYRNQLTPTIEYNNRPFLKLAGTRFNPKNLAPVSGSYKVDLRYYDLKTKKDRPITFAKNSYVRTMDWSPNGKRILVQLETSECVELWLVDVPTLFKKKIPHICLNSALSSGGNFHWLSDERIVVLKRAGTKVVEISSATPDGPVVKESSVKVAQNRTYQDLLKTPQDAEAFSQAVMSKITVITLPSFAQHDLGPADSYSVIDPSPNKKWLIVAKLQRPFSYVVPFYLFQRERMIWSTDGKIKKSLGVVGPFENVPIQGVITGPRELSWDHAYGQRYYFAEAQDGGDWKNKVPFREFIYVSTITSAKGDIKTEKIAELPNRYSGITPLEDPAEGVLISDYDRDTDMVRSFRLKPAGPVYEMKQFLSRNENDGYSDPGGVIMGRNDFGEPVGRIQKSDAGNFIYWSGKGATPDGDRPFIGKMNLSDMKMQEVFRSVNDKYEDVWSFYPQQFNQFIVRTESATDAPRFEIRSLENPAVRTPLFEEENPFKVMGQLKKKILKYKRKDGIDLTGILYYPLGYKEGQKYPAVVSAYPLEYTDAKSAGQTRGTANNFEIPFRATPIYFALHGYFVLDEAQIPIVGHPETKNDTFIEQLTSDAEATVKALDGTGAVDAKRIGVMGHSYGAFMVSHLLTHTKYFAAGIARSGAYNRTLTPFGFQGERRSLWEAKSTYLKLSPFLDADKMKFPLLLIHGLEDNNPGTFTLQSERYFEALKGQGATSRLVLLPTEPHGYNASESVNHVLWESFQWFDKYLK
ncbi:MAG: S9 family peptidase [Bdellovibrionaceae bacterium]|nr:S9 family peptidase [Pseudobdellovibrionaceae bacterium]